MMKRTVCVFLVFVFLFSFCAFYSSASDEEINADALWDYLETSRFGDVSAMSADVKPEFDFSVKSACLIEAETGTGFTTATRTPRIRLRA